MLYMYMPLVEALAVGMNFSVESILSHVHCEVNVIHKFDCLTVAFSESFLQ